MIIKYKAHSPQIDDSCYIAESANVVGDVEIKTDANIWFGAVIRGDVNRVVIGEGTNIQDNATVHEADAFPTLIGKGVTVGHAAIVHACTVEDNVLIGMAAVILDGAHIERDCIIGAGALVTKGKRIPAGSLVLGSPAKVIRPLTDDEIAAIRHSAKKYIGKAKEYKCEQVKDEN